MPRPTFADALNLWDARRKKIDPKSKRGEVVTVTPTVAMVRVGGSQKLQPARIPAGVTVQTGDWCMLSINEADPHTKWIISEIIGKVDISAGNVTESTYFDLFAPANFQEVPELVPGAISVKWDAPIQHPVVIEVQTSPDNNTWTTVLYSRGAYAIIDSDIELYVRIRSVVENGQTSAWSATLQLQPAAAASGGSATQTITNDYTIQSGHVVYWIGPVTNLAQLTIDGEVHII